MSPEDSPMLVLTRKGQQSIMIGDDIEISVLSILGDKVRIGVAAPRSVPVFRKEIYLKIQGDDCVEITDVTEEALAQPQAE